MGGDVYWAGKPHKPAYDLAFETAAQVLGRAVSPLEVLAIGDAIATDLAGAAAAGVDALFIASGIHHDATMCGGQVDAEQLANLFGNTQAQAISAMAHLA